MQTIKIPLVLSIFFLGSILQGCLASVKVGGPRTETSISTLPENMLVDRVDSRKSDAGMSKADLDQLNKYAALRAELERTCISRLDATGRSANGFTQLTNAFGWGAFGTGLVTGGLSTYVAAQPQLEKNNNVIISTAVVAIIGGIAAAVANRTASEASTKRSRFTTILDASSVADSAILEQNRTVEDIKQIYVDGESARKEHEDAKATLAAAQEKLAQTLPEDPNHNAVMAQYDVAKKKEDEAHQKCLDVEHRHDNAVAKLRAAMAVVGPKLDELQTTCRLING